MSLTNVNITNPLRDNKAIMLFTALKGEKKKKSSLYKTSLRRETLLPSASPPLRKGVCLFVFEQRGGRGREEFALS